MTVLSSEYINSVIVKVAETLNLTEWKHSLKKFENVGLNFFGVVLPVVLSGKISEQEHTFHLVLKLAPTDERYRVSGAVTLMFAREIFVYSMLLEQYRQQQLSTLTQNTSFVIPKCYYVCREYSKEAIAMQDMVVDGYEPYTRSMFLNYSHMRVALLSLARFHANSFILRKRNKFLYEEAENICVPLTLKANKRYMEVTEDRLNKAMEKFENTAYATKFAHLKLNQVKLIEATSNSVEEICICHGDIWKENILFKYEGSEPVSACLIDYQTARMCSLAYDVLYLIATSTDTNLRRDHFTDLLNIYYEEFERYLTDAGLESQETYTRESFEKDLRTVAPACVIMANTALWLASGLQQEGHVRSKQIFSSDEEKAVAIESYKCIMRSLVDDLTLYELLCL